VALVLPTDEIYIDDRNGFVPCANGKHFFAVSQTAREIRRSVDIHDELGALEHGFADRFGSPYVFADRDRDLDAADIEHWTRVGRRSEVALLVEHGIVRQPLLAVDAEDLAVPAHGRSVVELVADALGKSDHRHTLSGARRQLRDRLRRFGDERGFQQKVFGRIARDGQLGKRDEMALRGDCPLVRLEHPLGIADQIAHDGVDLGGGDAEVEHRIRIMTGARDAVEKDGHA
jgi:hypothetical protein